MFIILLNDFLVQVDCDEHKGVCSKFGVSGYPTIQWFPKGSLEPKKWVYVYPVFMKSYISI